MTLPPSGERPCETSGLCSPVHEMVNQGQVRRKQTQFAAFMRQLEVQMVGASTRLPVGHKYGVTVGRNETQCGDRTLCWPTRRIVRQEKSPQRDGLRFGIVQFHEVRQSDRHFRRQPFVEFELEWIARRRGFIHRSEGRAT